MESDMNQENTNERLQAIEQYNAGTQILQSLVQGQTASFMDDWESCIEHLEKAIELDFTFADAHHNLAHACLALLEHSPQRIAWKVGRDPEDRDYDGETFNKKAYGAVNIALNLKPEFPEAYNTLGKVLVGLGRHKEAIQAFEFAIQQSPDYGTALENREKTLSMIHDEAS